MNENVLVAVDVTTADGAVLDYVLEYDLNNGERRGNVIFVDTPFSRTRAIAIDESGILYALSAFEITKVDLETQTIIETLETLDTHGYDLEFDLHGNLLVLSTLPARILMYAQSTASAVEFLPFNNNEDYATSFAFKTSQ